MLQRPSAVGLFLCEELITEEGTKNLTMINSFSRCTAAQFPSDPIPFAVFALLTDGLGEVRLEVIINRLDNLDEVYRAATMSRFPDPLHTYRLIHHVRDCSFPIPGGYEVNLYASGEVIARRKLTIVPRRNVS